MLLVNNWNRSGVAENEYFARESRQIKRNADFETCGTVPGFVRASRPNGHLAHSHRRIMHVFDGRGTAGTLITRCTRVH